MLIIFLFGVETMKMNDILRGNDYLRKRRKETERAIYQASLKTNQEEVSARHIEQPTKWYSWIKMSNITFTHFDKIIQI